MATEVIMPKVDMDMTEGKIAHWYVKSGDAVTKGQLLFEIETDKATMEVDSPAEGTILDVHHKLGEAIAVGTPVAWIYAKGETHGSAHKAVSPAAESAAPPVTQVVDTETTSVASSESLDIRAVPHPTGDKLLRATPLARATARELGLDLNDIDGSGPDGRVVFADLPTQGAAQLPTVGDLHLNWISNGDGLPVVMLHGFGTDHTSWKILAGHFNGVPILGVDLPNHGKSPKNSVKGIHEMAEMVLHCLEAEGVCDFHLVGHSMGGAVAAELAVLAGNRLKSLTLLAPAGLGPDINIEFIRGLCRASSEISLKPWLAMLFANEGKLTSSFLATAAKQLKQESTRKALLRLSEVLMPDGTQVHSIRAALEGLRVPVRVIWGAEDQIIPLRHASMLPPRVALHVLRGSGHIPQVEMPELVAELLSYQLR